MKRKTTEQFILEAKKIHGDKFSYSKTVYLGSDNKVCITCKEHGDFWIIANNFLRGHGCPVCSNRQRINTAVFIERATKIHKGRYDYSLVDCKGTESFVKIICPVHGEFVQKAEYHLNGNGCPKCFGTPKSNTQEFIEKAKRIYGDKYDYSKADYRGNKTKLIIICKKHGEWLVSPNAFLRGSECPKCYGTPKKTTKDFIAEAKRIHGDKYDYSKVDYNGNKRKVTIICPIHGEFNISSQSHLKGHGCPVCSGTQRINRDIFVERSIKNHTIEYDYSKVSFKNPHEKVVIICPFHGEFKQGASYHMHGGNCPKCVGGKKLTKDEFIEKAILVHKNKYDYSKVEYKNYSSKVCIICPEHGEFWQTPNNHLFGAGCPTCPESNLEGEMRVFLKNHNIKFEQEKTFDWLKNKRHLFLDFYLPDYNIAIECQGGQHFSPIELFGGNDFYSLTLQRDKKKNDLCAKHGITIIYFSNAHIDYPYPVFEKLEEILNYINKKV